MSSGQSIFSGTHTLVEGSWFEDDRVLRELVYAELEEDRRQLFDRVHHIAYACAILHFLDEHPKQRATAEEIAFRLDESGNLVSRSLTGLLRLGLVRQERLKGALWFSLAPDPRKQRLVHDLFHWQRQWHQRLVRLEDLVDGYKRTLA